MKPQAEDRAEPDERPVHRLLLVLLRRDPHFARHFFPDVPDGNVWEGSKGFVDIIGGPERWSPPTTLIELKFGAKVSRFKQRNQFDTSVVHAADGAVCYVVVPGRRAGGEGEKYRGALKRAGVTTARQWNVVTWQSILDYLTPHIRLDELDPEAADAANEVALVMARLAV